MSQERLGSLRVVPHEDLGDAGRLGHALDLERELPRRMSVLLEGWMDCSRGRRVNVDPSALTWRRKTFTNGALGLAGWCRSALAFRRRVLRWRDNIVPGPGHGVGYRLACVYGVSVVPFLVATRDCRGDLRGCVRCGVGFSLRRSPGVPRNELEHRRRRFISKFVDPSALAGIAPGAIEDHRFRRGTGSRRAWRSYRVTDGTDVVRAAEAGVEDFFAPVVAPACWSSRRTSSVEMTCA